MICTLESGNAERPPTGRGGVIDQPMISHISLGVRDLDRAGAFYDAVLAAVGSVRLWASPTGLGYGPAGGNDKLALFPQTTADRLAAGPGFHLAFTAPDRESVDRFHAAALLHGGRCVGPPGPRPRYGPAYYAAFVRDPDGHKLEVKAATVE